MKQKLKRYAQFNEYDHTFDYKVEGDIERLNELIESSSKLILELACGKGEYTHAIAKREPESIVIGVDLKGHRLWRAAKDSDERKLSNAYFLRCDIRQIDEYFGENSVDEIWITFPGPFPKEKHIKRRLTHQSLLKKYRTIIKPSGIIHLKTDSDLLYEFTKKELQSVDGRIEEDLWDVYRKQVGIKNLLSLPDDLLSVKTTFEKMHLAERKTIHYLKFTYGQVSDLSQRLDRSVRSDRS